MRPQHRNVIGDGAGIGWPGADVDHGNAPMTGRDEMKGRHLRHTFGTSSGLASAQTRVRSDHVAGFDKGIGAGLTFRHLLAAPLRKDIHVELVVCEDHEVLEVLRIRAGVVVKPVQRIIDTRSAEQSQWLGRTGWQLKRSIGDGVVHGGKIGCVE